MKHPDPNEYKWGFWDYTGCFLALAVLGSGWLWLFELSFNF